MRQLAALCLMALALAACGPSNASHTVPGSAPMASPAALALRAEASALLARPELDLDEVTVQHCLVAVRNSGPFGDKPSLSHLEAEEVAANILAEVRKGSDFRMLVLRNTYDHIYSESEPGVLRMLRPADPASLISSRPKLDPDKGDFYRDQMTRWFYMAAWRLEVGEIGVIEKSGENSPYGFHIIKRLK